MSYKKKIYCNLCKKYMPFGFVFFKQKVKICEECILKKYEQIVLIHTILEQNLGPDNLSKKTIIKLLNE